MAGSRKLISVLALLALTAACTGGSEQGSTATATPGDSAASSNPGGGSLGDALFKDTVGALSDDAEWETTRTVE